MISRARAVLGAIILIVAAAALSAIVVSKWSPFPPKDYEDCAERAARDAKSKDALSVLLSVCRTRFVGRRKKGSGGYTYYDSCRDQNVAIKGPNPTPDELKEIDEWCSAYLDVQAEEEESERKAQQAAQGARDIQLQAAQETTARKEQEARAEESKRLQELKKRQQAALRSVEIDESKIDCYQTGGCFFHIAVTNGSRETVSKISLGWMFPSVWDVSCPSDLSTKEEEHQKLRPGERAWVLIEVADIPPYTGRSPRVCIKVTSVDIVP